MFDSNQIKKHIHNITNIDSFIRDMRRNNFIDTPSYCEQCQSCDFERHHIYACEEAKRWESKYIYHCKLDFIFIATFNIYLEHCLITGPIAVEELHDKPEGVTVLSTKAVTSISELIYKTYAFYNNAPKEISQSDLLSNVYKLSEDVESNNYYIKCERDIENAIISANRDLAIDLINQYLIYLLSTSNSDFNTIKFRITELIIILSRSVIKTGAIPGEVFDLERTCISQLQNINYSEELMSWLKSPIRGFLDLIVDLKKVSNKNVIYKATEYIKTNYSQKISLSDVANYVFISESYLCKIFKSQLNCNFTDYINDIRIQKSKELLYDTNVPIVQISNCTGFGDQSYFTKVFKKKTGISPAEYRKQRIN